jgi:hypothetical protein
MHVTVTGNGTNGTMQNAIAAYVAALLTPGAAAGGGQARAIALHRQTAAERLTPWTIPVAGPAPLVTVGLNGRNLKIRLKDMTVLRYEVQRTRRFRQQVFEVHSPVAPAGFQKLAIEYVNTDEHELATGAPANDDTLGFTEFPEHQLSVKMSVAPTGSPVYVLTKPANRKNSFCRQLVSMINAQAEDPNGHFPPLTIRTAQGSLLITPQNLFRAYAFFRYGEAMRWPFPSMRDWVAQVAPGGGMPDLTAVTIPEPTDEELIQFSNDPKFTAAPFPFATETLVLVYNQGGPVLPIC